MEQGLSQAERESIERASYEVDASLLDWYQSLSLSERLRSAVSFLTTLSQFRIIEDEALQGLKAR